MPERRIDPRTGSVEYVDDHGDTREHIDGLSESDLAYLRSRRGSREGVNLPPPPPPARDNGGWAPP